MPIHTTKRYMKSLFCIPGAGRFARFCGAVTAALTLLPAANATTPLNERLVLTEIQSNQASSSPGADYWELTNVGDTVVDLSNWKWDDDSRNPADAAAVTVPGGTTIAAGESIIFTSASAATFRNWFGISDSVKVVTGGPGLGQGDGIALFDNTGTEIFFFSYAASSFTQSNGSGAAGGHAGASGGGTATAALVIDPTFGSTLANRRYTAAVAGTFGAFVTTFSAAEIGSPGVTGLGTTAPAITLTVSVNPASFSESAANPAATGTVTRSGSTTSELVVTLSPSDLTEATVPASVTIPAGQASANFNVTAVDDSFPDGNKTSTITATATGATAGTFQVTVQDDGDVAALTLMVTEIQSNQSANKPTGAADYWELYNYGSASVNLSGYRWHDSAKSFAAAAVIPNGTMIAPGGSIIFTATPAAVFRAWWNLPSTVQVIESASAPGLGQNDGISLFDSGGNELFFFSYAASGFTRADGSPSTGGHAGPSAGGSADSVALIWVPTSGTTNPRYSFAASGTFGGGGAVAPATDVGSPSTTHAGPKSIDLSMYVRIGRYDLPEPTRTTPPSGSLLAQEASGVAYNWDTDTLFITADGGTSIVEVSKTGQLISSMTLPAGSSPQGTEFYDPEGITYVGNGQFVMSEERDRQLVLFTYTAGTTLTRAQTKTVKIGTFVPNTGTEGLSYDPLTGGFIVLKEIDPMGIFQTTVDFDAGTASNGSPTTENSVNLFDPALTGLIDVADVFALSNIPSLAGQPDFDRMLLLSHESARILLIDRSGTIHSTLNIVTDPGNPLSVVAQQHEGLTMDRDGVLYVVSENGGGDFDHPQLWVYAPATGPNQAPTAVTLNHAVTTMPENSSTTARVKVADIVVSDDGLGVNALSLTGTDVAFFEIIDTSLYIKANTVLDFETKASYSIVVNADDATVGNTPDQTVNYTLTLTDVVVETPLSVALVISEVAPWSSGNSPLGADWFEVTNVGTNAVDITGWKVDDSSASFASALALNGITSIAPGESVIFIETTDLATTAATFKTLWFGANPPAGLQIGSYSGGGIGLSTGGDAVNLYDGTGTVKASVTFGASPAGPSFPTFDNAAGLNNTAITQLSVVGLYEAATAANDVAEIGSPGTAGRLIISEVAPWSSGNSPVAADWFEVSNTGARTVNIEGWKVDDSSESPAAALALNGISSIAPGESVIFMEGADLNAARTAFINTWFGGNAPVGLQIGNYSGSGIGLSTGGDAVVLYDNLNRQRAKVTFGASPAGPTYPTFDNTVGLNATAITQLSAVGRYGAFTAVNDVNEIGSPGNTGGLAITEVAPWSSGNSPIRADWFEVSNVGTRTINIAGWKVDDSSASFAAALALNGVTNIAPGESVIFMETADLATTKATFLSTWFGASPPAKLQIGSYTGSGIGLSTGGDAVNLYDAGGIRRAGVAFGASSAGPSFPTFDNSLGLNYVALTQMSEVGRYGAFTAVNDTAEIGGPGTITTVPVVKITAPLPLANLVVPLNVTVQATASKFGGSISQVEFYLDGSLQVTDTTQPYEAIIPVTALGTHTFTAIATDNAGLRATNIVAVTGNVTPAITLVPLGQVAFTAPATVLLQANVVGLDNHLASVKFYANGTLLAAVTPAPYQLNWQNVPAGSYYVTAVAQPITGEAVTSSTMHVIVGPVGITAPMRTQDNLFRFQFVGTVAGKSHRIEASTDLVNWVLLGTIIPSSNTVDIQDHSANSSEVRFYRIIQE
ncbi:MAG: lamin tail domain-containing protein [Verrucomicrobiota bacterium]